MKIRTGFILAAILAATTVTSAFAQGSGADTYKAKCAMCHGADGLASGPAGKAMQVPAFNSPALAKATTAEMIAATTNGKGKMPAYTGKLTDAQIKEVVAYVRTLQK
ncbi:MAG TPA: cytochrome c [Acidobacteriaceae bacterium]|jgi:mono/diheme cytochrome c family protein|nr:cytochrome c [Acidobacteriaceae bacterium]